MSTGVREPLCSPALSALWGATPVWGGGFPPWPSENRHETHVTTKSQSSVFLKRETRQTWQCSFPLGPWDSLGTSSRRARGAHLPLWGGGEPHSRGRAPLPGAETGDSCPMAPSSLEIISSLALFYFFLTEEKAQKQLAGDSRASFSLPCPEGKKKAAASPRPGHVPGAGPLPPAPSAGGHVPGPGRERLCRLHAVPVFRARAAISQGSPEGQEVRHRGRPATATCPTCPAASAKVRARLSLSCFIRGLSDSPRRPLTVHLIGGRQRLRVLVTSW